MSTVDDGGVLPQQLVAVFGRLGPMYSRLLDDDARAAGLSAGRIRLLRALVDEGPQIMSRLRDELGVTSRNITQLVDGLQVDGFVKRRAHPDDRRATIIEVTPDGAARFVAGRDHHLARAAAVFDRLSVTTQRQLLDAAAELVECLADELGRPGPRRADRTFGQS